MKMNFNIYKNKTVVVTGHTGFKGSWLTQWLVLLGAKVVVFLMIYRHVHHILSQ